MKQFQHASFSSMESLTTRLYGHMKLVNQLAELIQGFTCSSHERGGVGSIEFI